MISTIIVLILFTLIFILRFFLIKKQHFSETNIIGEILIKCENNNLNFENILEKWIKDMYSHDLISLFMPENKNDVLILCVYYKKYNFKNTKLIAINKKLLSQFINEQKNLLITIRESPQKNIFLSCTLGNYYFDIILKLPYFNDKPNEVKIIDSKEILENLFF